MNYYEILEVDYNADQHEIKNAYKQMAKRFHPDVSNGKSTERMARISEAYHTLSDPYRRQVYDSKLFIGTVRDQPQNTYQTYLQDEMKGNYSKSAYIWGGIFVIAFFAIVVAGSIWIVKNSSEEQYERGLLAYHEAKYDEALYHLDESIQWLGENNSEAALLAGKILLNELNAPEMALEYLDKGIRYTQNNSVRSQLYELKGKAWQKLGNTEMADQNYKKAAEVNPAADS